MSQFAQSSVFVIKKMIGLRLPDLLRPRMQERLFADRGEFLCGRRRLGNNLVKPSVKPRHTYRPM